jgi:hypothetical protein
MTSPELLLINDAAQALGRTPDTLRRWEKADLPDHLKSVRGPRNRRYWKADQIPLIREWMVETRKFPGGALPHIKLTQEEIQERALRTTKDENELAT